MQHIGLIGLSYRSANLKNLEAFTIPQEHFANWLLLLKQHCQFEEMVYVSTCNRIECFYISKEDFSREHLVNSLVSFFRIYKSSLDFTIYNNEDCFYIYKGFDAIKHLFCVTSSIDSMVIGETEILRQVKKAYAVAKNLSIAKTTLNMIFEHAFKTAKQIHTETELTIGSVSMVSLAIGLIKEHIQNISHPHIVLIGSGEMSIKAAKYLSGDESLSLTFVNRTLEKAEHLANRFDGNACNLEAFQRQPMRFDVLITATSSTDPILSLSNFKNIISKKTLDTMLMIDLAIPHDLSDDLYNHPNIKTYDIESMKRFAEDNHSARSREVIRAYPIIDYQLEILKKKLNEAKLGNVIAQIQESFSQTGNDELEQILQQKLNHLSDEDQEILRKWTSRLTKRMFQIPIPYLKTMISSCECGLVAESISKDASDNIPHNTEVKRSVS